MSDSADDIRAMIFEARMERDGLEKCDECGDWSSDTVPCVKERTLVNAGYAEQDVPVRCGSLCGWCRQDLGAVPEADF